jgi:hypothetical protein
MRETDPLEGILLGEMLEKQHKRTVMAALLFRNLEDRVDSAIHEIAHQQLDIDRMTDLTNLVIPQGSQDPYHGRIQTIEPRRTRIRTTVASTLYPLLIFHLVREDVDAQLVVDRHPQRQVDPMVVSRFLICRGHHRRSGTHRQVRRPVEGDLATNRVPDRRLLRQPRPVLTAIVATLVTSQPTCLLPLPMLHHLRVFTRIVSHISEAVVLRGDHRALLGTPIRM